VLTIAESGLPRFESVSWYALAAPTGTPPAVVTRLNAAIAEAAQTLAIIAALEHQGTEPVLMAPEHTRAYLQDEIVKWKNVVIGADVRLD